MPKFIVTFEDKASDDDVNKAVLDIEKNGGKITNDFRPLLKSFSAEISEDYMDSNLKSLVGKTIKYIEPDGIVKTQGTL